MLPTGSTPAAARPTVAVVLLRRVGGAALLAFMPLVILVGLCLAGPFDEERRLGGDDAGG